MDAGKICRRRRSCLLIVLTATLAMAAATGCSPSQPAADVRDPLATADTTGDCFDKTGRVVKDAEAWLDISATRVYRSGGHFTVRIELRGDIPEAMAAGTFVEWDIFLDTDRNPNTGQKWQLVANDIGYEYMARVGRDSRGYSQLIYTVATSKTANINYRVESRAIEIYISTGLIGNAEAFDWVIATRKYVGEAAPDSPAVVDKAPNNGHGALRP